MKARHLIPAGLLIAAAVSLTTCTDGIFSIIEKEQKVITSTLPLTINIYDIANFAPGGPYYLAAGAVYRGTLNGDGSITWLPDDDSRPLNPPDDPMCIAMAAYGGELWGSFITSGGTLFTSSAQSFDGQTAVSGASTDGRQTGPLQVANGRLFVLSTADTSSYRLDSWNGAAWTQGTSSYSSPVVGIGWDGTAYWMATKDLVYRDAALDPPTFAAAGTATLGGYSIGSDIKGIYVDPVNAGRIFVTTESDGVLFTLNGGGTWRQVDPDTSGNTTVSYLCVAGPVNPGGANNLYLVGSDGFGYYTLSTSGSGDLSRFDDSTISLFGHSVAKILVDGANVFMGTHANGLWRATFNTVTGDLASGESWIHE
jgi:hypothetical protein